MVSLTKSDLGDTLGSHSENEKVGGTRGCHRNIEKHVTPDGATEKNIGHSRDPWFEPYSHPSLYHFIGHSSVTT